MRDDHGWQQVLSYGGEGAKPEPAKPKPATPKPDDAGKDKPADKA